MADEPHAKRIVLGVMGLAQSLGLTAVAEGVEVIEQVEDLRAIGCERAQGFYFAHPEPPEQAGDRLAQAAPASLLKVAEHQEHVEERDRDARRQKDDHH